MTLTPWETSGYCDGVVPPGRKAPSGLSEGVVTVNRLPARTDFGWRRMEQNRVVVTGLGTVNAIARSVPEFSRALQAGRCGIGPVTVFDTTEFRTHTGGEVRQFAPREMIPRPFPSNACPARTAWPWRRPWRP
ncbi:MAG: hypothetical protein EHM37_20090 [Deltaproteobacteria bacterium]|nr:MAG: hypothetical protein EHM37_20090 [Deltaproteobacteria bacterium]